MSPPPSDLTIRQAADALRDGSLTCLALTESVLQRIAATEPKLNTYITVTADAAREEAAAADVELRAGRDRGPLHGIPFALKDLIDTAGVRTTAGSALFRDRVPHEDAFVTGKLKRAGIVLTGKLGLHEFAFGTTSTNPHFGSIRNPWNLDHVPGGSSGGAAAAIAVGSTLGALGSDSGGSIRIPASLCGVVGLMATYGRVSRSGVLPLSWSLDHVGPLAKTVEDAALILNAIAGPDPADPSSADEPVDDYTSALGRDLRGLRIGLLRDPLWHDCDDEVVTACETAVDVLREQGAIVSEVELPLLARVRSARTLDILHRRGRRLPRRVAPRAAATVQRGSPSQARPGRARPRHRLHQPAALSPPTDRRDAAGAPPRLRPRLPPRRRPPPPPSRTATRTRNSLASPRPTTSPASPPSACPAASTPTACPSAS